MITQTDDYVTISTNVKTTAMDDSFQSTEDLAQRSEQISNRVTNDKIASTPQMHEYPYFGGIQYEDFTDFHVDFQDVGQKIQSLAAQRQLSTESEQKEEKNSLIIERKLSRNEEGIEGGDHDQSAIAGAVQTNYEYVSVLDDRFVNTRDPNSLILEQATEKALKDVADKITTSSNSRKNSIDPLNSLLLTKHLEGDKHHKTPTPAQSQRDKISKIASFSTNHNNTRQELVKKKEGDIKPSPVKITSQDLSQKPKSSKTEFTNQAIKASSNKVLVNKNKSISVNTSLIEKPASRKNPKEMAEENQEVPTETVDETIIEKYHTQLVAAIQKISIRTFLTLRSIIKPNENILTCCRAFVKLFSGLSDAIPISFSIMENIEWENIKVLFNSPMKIVKLISTLPLFIEYKKLPQRNINAAIAALSQIPYELGDLQNDAFYQMYEYIVSAIEYYKFYKPTNLPLEDFNWASLQLDSTVRASTLPQETITFQAVEIIQRKTSDNQNKTSVVTMRRQESPSIQVVTSSGKSKSPMRQNVKPVWNVGRQSSTVTARQKSSPSKQIMTSPGKSKSPLKPNAIPNFAVKPTFTQHWQKTARTSVSPLNETLSSRKSLQDVTKKVGLDRSSSQKKSFMSTGANLSFETHRKFNRTSATPISSVRNKNFYESFDSQYFTQGGTEADQDFGNTTSQTEFSEANLFLDEMAQRKRESLNYKAKVSRLLADHERYIKKELKTQAEEMEARERNYQSCERQRQAEYDKEKSRMEKDYMKDVKLEGYESMRRTKEEELKIQLRKNTEEMIETARHSKFNATQAEKRKLEKKKELLDQYKKKMEEKLAKKQKETEAIIIHKNEALKDKIENVEWKKKQVIQEQEKWRESYLTLSKLIGGAK